MSNTCVFCGKDCSFMATIEGCCVPCGDRYQQMTAVEHLQGFVKACREVERLEARVKELESRSLPPGATLIKRTH